MASAAIPSAAFKIYPGKPGSGTWAAWLTFGLATTAPEGFTAWCEALPQVEHVDHGFERRPHAYTATFVAATSQDELHAQILAVITQAETQLGHSLNIDDQGVHYPRLRGAGGFIGRGELSGVRLGSRGMHISTATPEEPQKRSRRVLRRPVLPPPVTGPTPPTADRPDAENK